MDAAAAEAFGAPLDCDCAFDIVKADEIVAEVIVNDKMRRYERIRW